MHRRLVCATAFVVAVLAPPAAADGGGPNPGLMQGWTGVTGPGQPLRYVTLPAGSQTVLASVRRSSGRVWAWRSLAGTWGVPMVANDATAGGLSRDGRLLVISDWNPPGSNALRTSSSFLLVNTKSLKVWRRIALRGDFAFDALSPGGGILYLIEHVSSADATRYRVRAYDIASERLLPQVIADRSQADWVMSGYPVTRATSADSRWVYTLYQQPGGYPFVHALDAANRAAVCIGIPWKGNQDILPSVKLRLDEKARTLTVQTRRGRPLFVVDTRTFWVTRPAARGADFPVALVAGPAAVASAAFVLAFAFRRRIRR
jgi:hypothetical protein